MADAAWGSWDAHSTPPKYGRPPQHPGSLQAGVPPWERRFCTSVCLIPWGRICAAQASLSAYKNIAEWDDAAAFEAFQNAKARYWAVINNLPCDIPLPDPEMYIDKVDHKVVIDPKLVEDLEKQEPPPLPDCKEEGNNGWDSVILENKQIPATGWGNAGDVSTSDHHSISWDKFVDQRCPNSGWGDAENHLSRGSDSSNAWGCHGGWGNGTVQDYLWGDRQDNNLCNGSTYPSCDKPSNNLNNAQGNRNTRKRSRGHYDPAFSYSRQSNNCRPNGNNNCRPNGNNWDGRRERNMPDYPYEKTIRGGQPMFMRQPKSRWSCGPVNHQKSADRGESWYWKKSAT